MRFFLAFSLGFLAILADLSGQNDVKPGIPPKGPFSPREQLASFRIARGFVIELVASEPDVIDPVALAFDELGRLFVAEMPGYPNDGVGFGKVTTGRIRMLEDVKGDGSFSKSTLFAQGLRLPNAVQPSRGGLLVSNAPDLIFLKDTQGTGKADQNKVLYTGFDLANIQQMLNGFQYGLDNWIYAVAGSKGGNIKSVEKPDAPEVQLRGRGIRFQPEIPGSLEPTTGGGQFGLASDDWDNWFVNTNSQHLRQIILPDHYLRRNPDLPVSAATLDISDHGAACKVHRISPFESWRVERTQRRKEGTDAKRFASTELVPGGFVTSGCCPLVYTGGLFPKEFHGNTFMCDPANNLIHRDILEQNGVPFVARRDGSESEFLASTDNWFRPVFLCQGPDGAIYVADFYREIIETPLSLPDDIKKQWNLNSRGKGRIWRIRPEGKYQPRPVNLAQASSVELAKHLEDPNRWWRMTAQRLLLERGDQNAVPELERIVRESSFLPGVVQAMWTLRGLKAFHPKWAIRLTQHSEPYARVHALRLVEVYLKARPDEDDPAFDMDPFRRLAEDLDAPVRFQAAFSLREFPTSLFKILMQNSGDPWITTAVLSSIDSPTRAVAQLSLVAVESGKVKTIPAFWPGLVNKLSALVGVRGTEHDIAAGFNVLRFLEKHPTLQASILEGLGQGLRTRQLTLEKFLTSPALAFTARIYDQLMEKALARAGDERASLEDRLQSLRLVALAPFRESSKVLQALLAPSQPAPLQLAAVQTLGQQTDPGVADLLLESWANYSPSIRREVLDVLFARPQRVKELLKQIEARKIRINQLEPAKVELLRKYPDAKIRAEAHKLLAGQIAPDRQKVLETYASALDLKPDPIQGRAIFKKTCAVCHRLQNEGVEVGADLQSVLPNKTPERLLIDILDPSREVDPRFLEYVLTTTDGKVLTGLIAAETAGSVTLRRAEKSEDTILRRQIETIQATTKSLMPEGLEMQLRPQDLADLIGYLTELGRKK